MDKAPKPLKIALFLVFLLLFTAIIPFMLHSFGIHCNSDGQTVKTSAFNVIDNIQIAFIDPNEQINTSSYEPSVQFAFGDSQFSCRQPSCHNREDFFWFYTMDECENETLIYPYVDDGGLLTDCIICDGDINFSYIEGKFGYAKRDYFCFGDAHRINRSDMGWLQKLLCKPTSVCMPPEHYYYDYSQGLYVCEDLDVCGLNNTIIEYTIDSALRDAGGEVLYTESNEKSYQRAMSFKCDKNGNANFTFFGIPIFDYKIWLVLIVISVMFIFLNKIKRH